MSLSSRRGWIKSFLLGSAASVGGTPWFCALVAEAVDFQAGPGTLHLALADFPPLQVVGGSVQIQLSVVEPTLTITRASSQQFYAMDSTCTHAGCTVGRFEAADGFIQCPCHGSRFDIQGRVIQGPADRDLTPLAAEYRELGSGSELILQVPDLPADIRPLRLMRRSGASKRLKLNFPVVAGARYVVRHHTVPAGTFSTVPFAVTPFGDATQTSLVATSDGIRTAYVDSAAVRGFYVVAQAPL